jgi:drug/metabolite transporter (DMT)-like permease
VVIGAISYGLLSVLIKWAYDDFSIAQVTSAQVVCGVAMLWLLVLMRPKNWSNPFAGPWVRLTLIGIGGLFLTTLLFNTSLKFLDASLSMVLLFQFTWITLLMDSIARRKLPSINQAISIVIIMIGTLLAVNIAGADFSTISTFGLLLGLASSITYAGFIFFTGRIQSEMDSVMRSAIMWTAAVPLVLLIWPPTYVGSVDIAPLFLWGVVLGLLGQVIPTITFNIGIPKIGSSLAAMIGSLELPAAIFFAYLILSESIGTWQWVGVLLIIAGIVVSEWKNKQ